jgi:methanogenic corrinoid protein MtbC1
MYMEKHLEMFSAARVKRRLSWKRIHTALAISDTCDSKKTRRKMMPLYDDLKAVVIYMEVEKAVELTEKALDEGTDAEDIMNSPLVRQWMWWGCSSTGARNTSRRCFSQHTA